ncbi:MAG: ATP-grasp domain-containing protein [Patescibacteria group bacterium]
MVSQVEKMRSKNILFVNWGTRDKKYPFQVAKKKKLNIFLATTSNYPKWIREYVPKKNLVITNPYDSQKMITDVVKYSIDNNIKFDAVVTFFEMSIVQTADLAASLGCVSITPSAVRRSSGNKALMRYFCKVSNIPTPKFFIISSAKQLGKVIKKIGVPVILKPVLSGRSYGAIKIDSVDKKKVAKSYKIAKRQLYGNFDEWMKYYGNYKDDFIVEKWIEGKVISVDGLIQNGKVFVVGLAEHIMCSEPMLFQVGLYIPARINNKVKEETVLLAKNIIKEMGYDNCAFHSEYKVKDNVPMLIEFAVRPPGGTMIQAYEKAYGVNIADKLLDISLSKQISFNKLKLNKFITQRAIMLPHPGVVRKIKGISEVKNIKEISDTSQIRTNEFVRFPFFVPQSGFYFQLESDSLKEIKTKEEQIIKEINFIYWHRFFDFFWKIKTFIFSILRKLLRKELFFK